MKMIIQLSKTSQRKKQTNLTSVETRTNERDIFDRISTCTLQTLKGNRCAFPAFAAMVWAKDAFSIETVIMAGHTLTLFSLISFCFVIRLTRRPRGRIQP